MNNSKHIKNRDPIKKVQRFININALILLFLILNLSIPIQLYAKVTGTCANCHTMHNSQNGSTPGSGPNANLMIALNGETDPCVGCHTASDGATWKDSATNAPIVWNQSEPTYGQKGLAGGNFYWVGAGDDTKGHNVYGIAAQDSNLAAAPGENPAGCGAGACHVTLAVAPSNENYYQGGCRGCHVATYHHTDNAVYRFLKGHGTGPYAPVNSPLPAARKNIATYTDYVTGVEDSDWEKTSSSSDHNKYKGTTTVYSSSGTALKNQQSITSFCSGCHPYFHGPYGQFGGSEEGMCNGTSCSSPWLRHPTDIALPQGDGSEYAAYNPATNYSVEAPVAWTNPVLQTGPVVMCLSCHRPHGSEQPDLLRWPYSNMQVGTTDSAKAGHGCFVCHTQKDGT